MGANKPNSSNIISITYQLLQESGQPNSVRAQLPSLLVRFQDDQSVIRVMVVGFNEMLPYLRMLKTKADSLGKDIVCNPSSTYDKKIVTEIGIQGTPANTKMLEGIVAQGDGSALSYYGFPITILLSDGSEVTFLKKSAEHGTGDSIIMTRTTDWINYETTSVKVAGIAQTCFALAGGIANGFVHICYQPDSLYTSISFLRISEADLIANFSTANFTLSGSIAVDPTTEAISICNSRLVRRSDGKLMLPFYETNFAAGTPFTVNTLATSIDDGLTWVRGAVIRDSRTAGNLLNFKSLEANIEIIDDTGVVGTTKMFCLMRSIIASDGSGNYYLTARSADGGETWDTLQTNAGADGFIYYLEGTIDGTGGTAGGQNPVSIKKHTDGLVYVGGCVRNLNVGEAPNQFCGYLNYFTASPADLYNNNTAGFSALVKYPYISPANFIGGAIHDYGYSYVYEGNDGELWMTFYDWRADLPAAQRVEAIVRRKITNFY